MSKWNIVNEGCDRIPQQNLAHLGIWRALKAVINKVQVNDFISNYDIEMNLLIEMKIRYLYSNSTMRNYLRLLTKCNILETHRIKNNKHLYYTNETLKFTGYKVLRHYDKTVRFNDLKLFSSNWLGWFLEPGETLTRNIIMGDVNVETKKKSW